MNALLVAITYSVLILTLIALIKALLGLIQQAPPPLALPGCMTYHPQFFVELMQTRNHGAALQYWKGVSRS